MPGVRPETIGSIPGGSPSLYGLVPRGVIVMWSGRLRDVPAGWALCDGTMGTPNLVARFARGVASATTNPGGTGGADSITVVQDSHAHEMPIQFKGSTDITRTASVGTGSTVTEQYEAGVSSQSSSIARQKVTSTTATNQAHDNRPAYYELAYIMKL